MNNAERFAKLFRGFTSRFGRYDMHGARAPEEKVAGRARTVDEEITLKEYEEHILGNTGIGVIPLREDNTIHFAALDVDVYKAEDQKAKNLTHADVALALKDTPLIVSRSKSGGIHVWLFSEKGVPAQLAVDYLNATAALLGVGGCEVFPKQVERHSESDVGNWINLPYFGDTRKAVIPNKSGTVYEFLDASLDQFLTIAEAAAEGVTSDWLLTNTDAAAAQQRGENLLAPLFLDGPPCLQSLCIGWADRRKSIQGKFDRGEITADQYEKQMKYTKPQLREGSRDMTFFQVALYLRRRLNEQDPDAEVKPADLYGELCKAQERWGSLVFGDHYVQKKHGLSNGDLMRLATQAAKGKWGYACTKEPIKPFCNRRLCLKRKFGVGTTQNDESNISGFTIVESEERQYYLTIDDKRVYIEDPATLHSQSAFALQVMNQTDRVWRMMQDAKYKEMLDNLLRTADKIAPPPDSDRRMMVLTALIEFIEDRKIESGKNDAAIHTGRVILSTDETTAEFKCEEFLRFLSSRGFQLSRNKVISLLTNEFGVQFRGNKTIGSKQIRPYVANRAFLRKLSDDFEQDRDG